MTAARYLVARHASWTLPGTPPSFVRPADGGARWTNAPADAAKLTADEAATLRDAFADYSAHHGRGEAFAVVAEIDTQNGPAHRELTPAELEAERDA